MDPLYVVMLLALAAGSWFLWRQYRGAPTPPESDTWELPPEDDAPGPTGAAATPSSGPRPAPTPQVLTRESLLNRDRELDPSRWDDTPDAGDTWDADDAGGTEPPARPPVLDRDALRRPVDGQ